MGFGWLFVGYFTATVMTMTTVGAFVRPIGYLLMLYALYRLKDYHRDFWYALYGGAGMLALSLVLMADKMLAFLPLEILHALGYVEMVASFAFHALLLWGIRAIAKQTEVEKISFAAARNFAFLAVYNLLYVIGKLPFSFTEQYAKLMSIPVLLLYVACLVLNLILIFSCYATICDVDDEDMAIRPSRFAFVNEMRAEAEQRRAEKAARYAQKERERKERREQKKK